MSYAAKYTTMLVVAVIGGLSIVAGFSMAQAGDMNAVWLLAVGFVTFGVSIPFVVYFKSRRQIQDERTKRK